MLVTKSLSTWAVLILYSSQIQTQNPSSTPSLTNPKHYKRKEESTRGRKRGENNQRTRPSMKRSEEEEEEGEEFKHLQYDWSSSKKLSPHCPLHQSADAEIIQLMDTSPRELISSLQKFHKTCSSSGWKVRTNHLAVEDVIRERRAVIKSGRLKGRRLFDAFEGRGEMDFQEEEKCSVSSSIMIHGSEVRSLCSSLSREDDGDEAEAGDRNVDGGDRDPSKEKERVISVEEKGGIVHRLWWMVRVAWISLAVVVFALLIISGKSFDRRLDGRRLIPT